MLSVGYIRLFQAMGFVEVSSVSTVLLKRTFRHYKLDMGLFPVFINQLQKRFTSVVPAENKGSISTLEKKVNSLVSLAPLKWSDQKTD